MLFFPCRCANMHLYHVTSLDFSEKVQTNQFESNCLPLEKRFCAQTFTPQISTHRVLLESATKGFSTLTFFFPTVVITVLNFWISHFGHKILESVQRSSDKL